LPGQTRTWVVQQADGVTDSSGSRHRLVQGTRRCTLTTGPHRACSLGPGAKDNRRAGLHRPRGWLRQFAALLTPRAAAVGRLALERDVPVRRRRLGAASREAVRERFRPTRPRMRALVAWPGGRLCWRAVPAPPPPGGCEAVVRPIAMATCDLDRALALGATQFPLPLRFGHECVAEVLSVGGQVTSVVPGQRVVVPFQISCGACAPCRQGRTGNCGSVPPFSMYGFGVGGGHWGGVFCEQVAVPFADAMLVPLPDGLDPLAAASVGDNVCDGYRHIAPHLPRILRRDPGAEVLIIAGVTRRPVFSPSVSLYAGLVARALGAGTVYLADTRPPVRDHAARLSLVPLHPGELRSLRPAPLVVEASALPRGLALAISKTATDGICSSIGTLHVRARLPAGLMYARNVTLHMARAHARALIPPVLTLMEERSLHPEAVTTTVASLDDAPAVLRDHLLGDSTKTILFA
jgi:alcohol dehydrogenase